MVDFGERVSIAEPELRSKRAEQVAIFASIQHGRVSDVGVLARDEDYTWFTLRALNNPNGFSIVRSSWTEIDEEQKLLFWPNFDPTVHLKVRELCQRVANLADPGLILTGFVARRTFTAGLMYNSYFDRHGVFRLAPELPAVGRGRMLRPQVASAALVVLLINSSDNQRYDDRLLQTSEWRSADLPVSVEDVLSAAYLCAPGCGAPMKFVLAHRSELHELCARVHRERVLHASHQP